MTGYRNQEKNTRCREDSGPYNARGRGSRTPSAAESRGRASWTVRPFLSWAKFVCKSNFSVFSCQFDSLCELSYHLKDGWFWLWNAFSTDGWFWPVEWKVWRGSDSGGAYMVAFMIPSELKAEAKKPVFFFFFFLYGCHSWICATILAWDVSMELCLSMKHAAARYLLNYHIVCWCSKRIESIDSGLQSRVKPEPPQPSRSWWKLWSDA